MYIVKNGDCHCLEPSLLPSQDIIVVIKMIFSISFCQIIITHGHTLEQKKVFKLISSYSLPKSVQYE
jgi:hypothetical protein